MCQKFLNKPGNLEVSLKVTFFNPHPKAIKIYGRCHWWTTAAEEQLSKGMEKSQVLVMVTIVVIEHDEQKQLEEEQVSYAHICT